MSLVENIRDHLLSIWDYFVNNPATAAAFLSLVAALLSVIATWYGPRSAAKLAEKIRRKSELDHEKRRMKMHVFATLLQERATMVTADAVRMLNSVDLVFHDSPNVRREWANLFAAFDEKSGLGAAVQNTRFTDLLSAMAADIGFSKSFSREDLTRVYFPNALAREAELQRLQQEKALLAMRPQNGTQEQALDPALLAKFPPRPDSK